MTSTVQDLARARLLLMDSREWRQLTPLARLTYHHACLLHDASPSPEWPSVAVLARDLRATPRAVRAGLMALERAGFIWREQRTDDVGANAPSRIILLEHPGRIGHSG